MTPGKKIGLITLGFLLALLVLFLGTATVHEDGLVKFRVKGTVFAEDTSLPLGGVEVLLLLDEQAANDKEEINRLYELYSPMWHESIDESEWIGKSRNDGEYVAEGGRRYSRKYTSVFGLGKPKGQPFREAWLVFHKKGYELKVIEVKTTGWKHADISAETFNAAEDVYLIKE